MPLLVMAFIILFLYPSDVRIVFNPPILFPLLSSLTFYPIVIMVAYVAAKSFLMEGSCTLLLMGAGIILLGASGSILGWSVLLSGPGTSMTMLGAGVLASALLILASSVLNSLGLPVCIGVDRSGTIALFYSLALITTVVLASAAALGVIPSFFVEGKGVTIIGDVVLRTAASMFILSSLLYMRLYLKERMELLYWYSLALLSFGVGLIPISHQTLFGSLLGWSGGLTFYVGAMYLLVMIVKAFRRPACA